ncbi:Serine hydrolase FSH [Moelleriella libera RCEF 2490]|uniref:Serine hydrolase FSH n=1 Tax=Moelleriella libera RCEF 2490 TaxID=1081109 RepID=A0A166NQU5_9HYPO|nr:Serine hydrolase FSH [Moelleriella libera RCEF 2490]
MTVLCLHGAYGSASLRPFVDAAEKCSSAEFKWVNGAHVAQPPPGFDEYFGPGPLYRFIDIDGVSALDDMLSKLREFPEGLTAEDTMRRLVGQRAQFSATAVRSTLDRLIKTLDEDPSITGVLGYSEGATVAASLVLEEKRRFEEDGRPRRIQNAVFFAGWPPVGLDNNDEVHCLLADECENLIDVPTCHVVGCNDPYIDGAMALFSMCDEDTAQLFDHGKGHTLPRDARTLQELVTVVNDVWSRPREVMV